MCCCFLWISLMAFLCSLVSLQVFRQQSVCVFGHWRGDCLSERSRWAVFAIWENLAVICRICIRFLHSKTTGSFWDPQSSQTLVLGTASNPITKMVSVGGKLWCGSQNKVLIINTTTLEKEVGRMCAGVWGHKVLLVLQCLPCPQHWFQVGADSSRCVTCMVAYGQGVWLALQGSAQVRLYHAQSWENLTEVDVAPAVHKMLASNWHLAALLFSGSAFTDDVSVCCSLPPQLFAFGFRCRCNHQTAQGCLFEDNGITGV